GTLTTVLLFFLIFTALLSAAQNPSSSSEDPMIAKAQGLVNYYRFLLNNIGSATTPVMEKEVIIQESYAKVFKDANVQIEDDLMIDRKAITNKNVQAYLRDVDFFFRRVSFDFQEIDIRRDISETGKPYYLVSFVSKLTGISLEGEAVSNTVDRFLEINVDPEGGLQIVSVYTTKISREQALTEWWADLSKGWADVFRSILRTDREKPEMYQLTNLLRLDSLNIAGNEWVDDATPLAMLRNLRYVNLEKTAIEELTPLRYALNLEELHIARTPVSDLRVMEYFRNLKILDISETRTSDLSPLRYLSGLTELQSSHSISFDFSPVGSLTNLKKLNLSHSVMDNLSVLSPLTRLEYLNLDHTNIPGLMGIESLTSLRELNISNTYIKKLDPLKGHKALQTLSANHTQIDDLSPLSGNVPLKKIYVDFSGISDRTATAFMKKNPRILVITNTARIMAWWEGLSRPWQQAFSRIAGWDASPSREGLIQFLQSDSLSLEGFGLDSGEPLRLFSGLTYLNISDNPFASLDFAADLSEMVTLQAKNLPITDVSPLSACLNLAYLDLEGAKVTNLSPLNRMARLSYINLDGSGLTDAQARQFLVTNEQTVLIYQTAILKSWWQGLDESWKNALMAKIDQSPDSEHLHRLIEQRELAISGQIRDLEPVSAFIRLEKLRVRATQVTSLAPVTDMPYLKSVECSEGPLADLSPLADMPQLEELTLSNTPVEDLRPISRLYGLKKLNCSGTQIKSLKPLEGLSALSHLNISNTKVWQLAWLFDLLNLQELICYNTRISENKLEEFNVRFPDCTVTYY
ncbi:MAG: hypothetical protein OEY56_07470, partial [Cyclobacteriaceae bacterium]|nr:hypothetical protein [Cyclobacteriaceae bacterium]